ncbi:hypothetical protein [Candidatus Cyanaurora vandensis]|uniref:hypothetical protein n=1 Tax=Candidatus Cyanaurora vandensis TaxID=2714958 RepID=UPI00257FBC94|nr:hypothetical protein [Candidatus Cyanaurora vandensis]
MKKLLCAVALGVILTGCSDAPKDSSAATPATPAASKTEFVAKADDAGTQQTFTRAQLKQGYAIFKAECSKCHVGGQTYGTYNVREINLSLDQLKGATPPLDNVQTMVAYMKKPLTYDGTENLYDKGRHPKFDNFADEKLVLVAGHILKEANFNPAWGKGKDVR